MSQILSRVSRERDRLMQEKCLAVLSTLLADMDNKYCVDCDAKGPRWVSWNLGVFLCIRCAGIHRNLGVHISKVKSVNLDTWKPEQVTMIQQVGNRRARAAYEANLPLDFRRPQTDSALETFIRAKYEHNKYTAKDWQAPSVPKVNWDDEIEAMRKRKDSPRSGGVSLNLPAPNNHQSPSDHTAVSKVPTGDAVKQQKPSPSSGDADLLGLSLGDSVTTPVSDAKSSPADSADLFGDFLSASVAPATNNSSESNLSALASLAPIDSATNNNNNSNGSSGGTAGSGGTPKSLSHDSIMALYGKSAPVVQSNIRPSASLAGPGAMAPFPGGSTAFSSTMFGNNQPQGTAQSNMYGSQMAQLHYNSQMTAAQVGQCQNPSVFPDSRPGVQHHVPSQYHATTMLNTSHNLASGPSQLYQPSLNTSTSLATFPQASASTPGSLGAFPQTTSNTSGTFPQTITNTPGTFPQTSTNTPGTFPQTSTNTPGTFPHTSTNTPGTFPQTSTNTPGSLSMYPQSITHPPGTLSQPSTQGTGLLRQPNADSPNALGSPHQPNASMLNQAVYGQQQQQQFFQQMSQMSLTPSSTQLTAPSATQFLSNPFS